MIYFEPRHEKLWFILYENNKDADQTAHPRSSLISVFVVHWLDNIIPILAKSKISRLYLVSETEQSLTWLQTPKTDILVTWLF